MNRLFSLAAVWLLFTATAHAQCGQNYDREVARIVEQSAQLPHELDRAVFAGSSSFRLWRNLSESFPEFEVVNAGIGGSCFADLYRYREELITQTKPDVLILYEGDNDAVHMEEVGAILKDARQLFDWLNETHPELPVYVLSPKPSPARWSFLPTYLTLNKQLAALCLEMGQSWIDCWPALTDGQGQVREEFFIHDRLHLNDRGNEALGRVIHATLLGTAEANAFVDQWHAHASHADYLPYFQKFASPKSIFQGTDGSEYWTAAEFRRWASPYFTGDEAWTFVPSERQWYPRGDVWWFSERLDSEHMGKCRGTGVLVQTPYGFKLDFYSLSFEVPNSVVADLVAAAKPARVEALEFQSELNRDYKDSAHSPLSREDRLAFRGHDFYPISMEYVVSAQLQRTPESEPFDMASTTGKPHRYRQYGLLTFELSGATFTLPVYQSLRLMNLPEYSDHLFFPFKDLTTGSETYGTGRFMDLRIPEGDLLELNFNKAYNPYCAYSDRYSCPITPAANFINAFVRAGIRGPLNEEH